MNTGRKNKGGSFALKRTVLTCCLAVFILIAKGQDLIYKTSNLGFNVGGNIAIGTHFQRIGLNFNLFYVNDFFQSNTEMRVYFNFRNLGPRKEHGEFVLSQGVLFGYGGTQTFFNPFINSVSNQTGYFSSVGYSYNVYLNKVKTKQLTGTIGLQFDAVSLIVENDVFAWPALDRFRTGAFLIQYQHRDLFQAAINCTMWTGQFGFAVRGDTTYPAVGYIDTLGGRYTSISHGLLSAQMKYHVGLSQIAQGNIGLDAEQVRNAVQNKIIHDVCFLPKSWFKRHNCHIPMVDSAGNEYLYRQGQKIRKPKAYINIFSNASLFY